MPARNTEDMTGTALLARRGHRSKLERRRIVEESLQPGASVAVIARSHGVNPNQVFHWRKLYREGRLDVKPPSTELMPVQITELVEQQRAVRACSSAIQIEIGRARVRVKGSADADTLRIILEQLGPWFRYLLARVSGSLLALPTCDVPSPD